MRLTILFCSSLFLVAHAAAQEQHPHFRLSQVEFGSVAARCAPGVPRDTLIAIARTESGLNPNAMSINRPKAVARAAGHADGELILTKQPKIGIFDRHRPVAFFAPTILSESKGLGQLTSYCDSLERWFCWSLAEMRQRA